MRSLKQAALTIYRSFFSIPFVKGHEVLCEAHVSTADAHAKTLDLGCGKTPKNPFNAAELFGVDVDYGIDAVRNIVACDLGMEKLPFPDNHFEYVTAFDLLEHVPRLMYRGSERHYPFIFLMTETHRVLKPGGLFLSDTPAYPRFSAFADPTHVNVITSETFRMYFCSPFTWAERYGFVGTFSLLRQAWCKENLLTLMRKEA